MLKGNCHRGHGTFEWDNGSFFEGSWVEGLPNGYGDFYYENGDRFKGQFPSLQKVEMVVTHGKTATITMEIGTKIK